MITVIPQWDMLDDVARVQGIVMMVMLFFVILTSFGGTFFISWLVRRIEHLVGSMKVVQSGNLDVHLDNHCTDAL